MTAPKLNRHVIDCRELHPEAWGYVISYFVQRP